MGIKKDKCYCCHKVKEGTYIKRNAENCDNDVFVCHSCNHLEPKNEQEK